MHITKPVEVELRCHAVAVELRCQKVFPSILIQLENGVNEFYFYFTNLNGNNSPGAVTGGNLINLAAGEKTKRKNITEHQFCTGMSRKEIKKYN